MLAKPINAGAMTIARLQEILGRLERVPSGCWEWQGWCNGGGYGRTEVAGRTVSVHRALYAVVYGEPSLIMLIDHICSNRLCANPKHLRTVTYRQNSLLSDKTLGSINIVKTHCAKGHEYDEANTYIFPRDGSRQCRMCKRIARKNNYYKHKFGLL